MPHARVRILLSLVLAAFFASLPSFALDDLPQPEDAPDPVVVTEEVLVVGEKEEPATEMKEETVELFAIAGAATDPLQAIYALPGVTFSTSEGPGGSDPVIRGSAPQDNAYFIDWIPASYIFHLFGNSIFDHHAINSFELYPAAFPSKYGNATGGIIDVALREPKKEDFATTLHTSLLTAGVLAETGIGDHQSIYAAYRRSTMDLLLDENDLNDDDEGFTIDDLPVSSDYVFKYLWRPDARNSFSLVAIGATDTLAATFEEDNREALRDPDFAGPASLEQGFDSQGITWNWQGDGREAKAVFSHSSENDDLIYGRDQHEKTAADRYVARAHYWQTLNENHSLSAGALVEDRQYELDFNAKLVACNDLDPECSTVDAEYVSYRDSLKVLAHEIYAEDRWTIAGKHAFTFGLHYAGDDYLGSGRVEPRLRFDYQIGGKLSAYAAAGQYSQLPQLREMIEVLGNPDLETIKADHYALGFSQAFGGSWRWNADVYYKNLQDVVISAEQDGGAANYSNRAEGRAYGLELVLRKDLRKRWSGWASLSLSKSERTNTATGETIDFEHDKPVLFNLVGNRLFGKHWTLGFVWNYQSGARYTPVVDLVPSSNPAVLEPVYGRLNSERYPAYHRLDFRAEYLRPKSWGHWKLYLDIINLYDHENVSEYEYAPDGKDLIATPPGYGPHVPVAQEIRDGLFPSLGFELRF
jgi:hypothetical protein